MTFHDWLPLLLGLLVMLAFPAYLAFLLRRAPRAGCVLTVGIGELPASRHRTSKPCSPAGSPRCAPESR
jgi:hypothetical protein